MKIFCLSSPAKALPIIILFMCSFAVKGTEKHDEPATVTFAGVDIIELQRRVGAFLPKDRADAIIDRLNSLSESRIFDASSINIFEHDSGIDIDAGDMIIATITPEDAKALNTTNALLANKAKDLIIEAIKKDRELKSPRSIGIAFVYTAGTTLALIALLIVLWTISKKLVSLLFSLRRSSKAPLKLQALELLASERIASSLMWLIKAARNFLILIAFYFYISIVLSYFPWTANLAPQLFGYIINPIKNMGHIIISFVPNIFLIFFIILFARIILAFVNFIFLEISKGKLRIDGFHDEWARPTYKLVRFFVLALTLVMIFPYLPGSSSAAFQGVSLFVGIILSFGSSSAVANIIAGIVLTYMRPFNIGDRVKLSDTVGDVAERTLLVTKIKTVKNVYITVPNSMVLGSHIINYSSSAESFGLILNTKVSIGYDVPWPLVHELLMSAATNTENALKSPKPFVLQTCLDDFYVSYQLNVYTDKPGIMEQTYSELHQNIQDAFNNRGIEIMSPHYTALRDGNQVVLA